MGLTKPTGTPIWGTNLGVRTDPGLAKQETGWVFQEAPPASVMNHIQGVQGDFIQWLAERIADGNGGAPTNQFQIPDFGLGFLTYYAQFDNNGLDLLDGDLRIQQNGINNGGRLVFKAGEIEYFASGTSHWEIRGGNYTKVTACAPTREANPAVEGEINRRNTVAVSGVISSAGAFTSGFNIASVDTNVGGVPGRYRINFIRPIQTTNRVVLMQAIDTDRQSTYSPFGPFQASSQIVDWFNSDASGGISVPTNFAIAIIGA